MFSHLERSQKHFLALACLRYRQIGPSNLSRPLSFFAASKSLEWRNEFNMIKSNNFFIEIMRLSRLEEKLEEKLDKSSFAQLMKRQKRISKHFMMIMEQGGSQLHKAIQKLRKKARGKISNNKPPDYLCHYLWYLSRMLHLSEKKPMPPQQIETINVKSSIKGNGRLMKVLSSGASYDEVNEKKVNFFMQSLPHKSNLIKIQPHCLYCIQELVYDRKLSHSALDNTFFLPQIDHESIEKFACALANQGGGIVLVGLRQEEHNEEKVQVIKGVKIRDEVEYKELKDKIQNLFASIKPSLESYKISLIPLFRDFMATEAVDRMNRFVIKIQIHENQDSRWLYLESGIEKKLRFVGQSGKVLKSHEIYWEILDNYKKRKYKKIKPQHYNLECQRADFRVEGEMNENQEQLGSRFRKSSLQYHFLLMVNRGQSPEQALRVFMSEQNYQFEISEIYGQVYQNFAERKFLYLSFTGNRERMEKQFSGKQTSYTYGQIGEKVVVLNNSLFTDAFKLIESRKGMKGGLEYAREIVPVRGVESCQYSFRFKQIEQAVEAFVILTANKIPVEFLPFRS